MNEVTSITPQSVAADKEPKTAKMWRILRRGADNVTANKDRPASKTVTWIECEPLPSTYGELPPDAEEVGPKYGEGEYLLIEADGKYDFRYTHPLTVVAEKKWVSA